MRVIRLVACAALAAVVSSAPGAAAAAPRSHEPDPGRYRVIFGVSMGAYGATNIALKHPGTFRIVAALGGPLDTRRLLRHLEYETLGSPIDVGGYPYDNFPPYPDRDSRISGLQDLIRAFGNPVLEGTPTRDDEFDPEGTRAFIHFLDGGDEEPIGRFGPEDSPDVFVPELLAVDEDGSGARERGEPVIRNFHEPFDDADGDREFDPGETFTAAGLDGVAGTGDFGEGNGTFDEDPDIAAFDAENPIARLRATSDEDLKPIRFYLDAGLQDEFNFDAHARDFFRVLRELYGKRARKYADWEDEFPHWPDLDGKHVYVEYTGGHVGARSERFEEQSDDMRGALERGEALSDDGQVVANRLFHALSYIADRIPDARFRRPRDFFRLSSSDIATVTYASASLGEDRQAVVYLPPGYTDSETRRYPVIYFLGGHGMQADSLGNAEFQRLLDLLLFAKRIPEAIWVFVDPRASATPGARGSWYVNHVDGDARYEDDIVVDLIPFVESRYRTKQ